jgi:hypothetical protein
MPAFDRFLKSWASQGPISPPTDQQADIGWDYIGNNPPTVQQFNAIMQWLDQKDNWLFRQLATVMSAASINAAESPDNQLLSALRTLFPDQDLTYLYNSINQVVSGTGLTPDNVTPRLWAGINAYFATKAEVSQRVLRSGDTMPYLNLSGWPGAPEQAARKDYVDAVVAPKVNRSGDTMTVLGISTWPSSATHATRKDYVDGGNNFNGVGYKTMPGGLILQWGRVAQANRAISTGIPISFATGFPGYCFGVYPTIEMDDPGLLDMQPGISAVTQWGATVQIGTNGPWEEGSVARTFGVQWFAVGF